MRKNIKKYIHLLKLDEYEYFIFSIIFLILLYLNLPLISIVVGLLISIMKKKGLYLFFTVLLVVECSHSNMVVLDVKEHYSLVQYENQTYYTREKNLVFGDEIIAEYELKYLEDSDFNSFFIHRGINQEIVFKKIISLSSSYHPKAVLYRYIKENVDITNQNLVFSVFFNYKYKNFIFYSLHYPVLFIILEVKKRNKSLALVISTLFLVFDFKLIILTQMISIILSKKLNKHDLLGLQCIISAIIFKSSLFSISFYFFIAFKLVAIFYSEYKLKMIILYLLSIFFFHQIPLLNIFLFKPTRWLLMINFLMAIGLLFYPPLLNYYASWLNSILNLIPYLSFNHTLSIFSFMIVVGLILFMKNKKFKILIYLILLYPNSWKFYQEIIFIPTYNDLIIIEKPNFFQKPIVYSTYPISDYYLNQYGINDYNLSDINTKRNQDNYLIYFNDVFYVGNYDFEYYQQLPINYYITKKVSDEILINHDVDKVILFNDKDKDGKEELKLLGWKKEYLATNKTVRFIYFLNQKMIIK